MDRRGAQFAGDLAIILWKTLRPSAMWTGVAVGGSLAAAVLLTAWLEMERVAPLLIQAVLFLFVLRVALNSAYGEPMGGFFEASGPNWPDVFAALGRLFLLNLTWAVPMMVLGTAMSEFGTSMMMGGAIGAPMALLLLAMTILPPLYLVASVAAHKVSDLWDVEHWMALFRGRAPDLSALFATYLGGTIATAGLSFMLAGSLGSGKAKFTVTLMALAGAYTAGIFVLLLGRLVGGFIRTGGADVEERAVDYGPIDPVADEPIPPSPQPSETDEHIERVFDLEAEIEEVERRQTVAPRPSSVDSGRSQDAGPRSPEPGVSRSVRPVSDSTSLSARLQQIQRTSQQDPSRAIDELQKILHDQGPHPTVMGRVAIYQHRQGRPEAVKTAVEAAALATRVGNVGVLGELYEAFSDRISELGVPAEQWQKVAVGQQALGRYDVATDLYGRILGEDPANRAAIKGLIQIAELHMKGDRVEAALAIYDGLDKLGSDHPFVDFVEQGRETAERRLERSV